MEKKGKRENIFLFFFLLEGEWRRGERTEKERKERDGGVKKKRKRRRIGYANHHQLENRND